MSVDDIITIGSEYGIPKTIETAETVATIETATTACTTPELNDYDSDFVLHDFSKKELGHLQRLKLHQQRKTEKWENANSTTSAKKKKAKVAVPPQEHRWEYYQVRQGWRRSWRSFGRRVPLLGVAKSRLAGKFFRGAFYGSTGRDRQVAIAYEAMCSRRGYNVVQRKTIND